MDWKVLSQFLAHSPEVTGDVESTVWIMFYKPNPTSEECLQFKSIGLYFQLREQ